MGVGSASERSILYFLPILKYAYRFQASNIVRDEQKNQFIRELMDQYELDIEDEHEFTSGVRRGD